MHGGRYGRDLGIRGRNNEPLKWVLVQWKVGWLRFMRAGANVLVLISKFRLENEVDTSILVRWSTRGRDNSDTDVNQERNHFVTDTQWFVWWYKESPTAGKTWTRTWEFASRALDVIEKETMGNCDYWKRTEKFLDSQCLAENIPFECFSVHKSGTDAWRSRSYSSAPIPTTKWGLL